MTVLEELTFTVHVAPTVDVHPVHPPKLLGALGVAVSVTVVEGIETFTPGQVGPQAKPVIAGEDTVPFPVPDFATVRTLEPATVVK